MNDLWHIVQTNSNFSSKELKVYIIPWHASVSEWIRKVKRAHGGCLGSQAMKDVISCDESFGEVQMTFDPEISRWDNPILKRYYPTLFRANAGNWNILVPGKENKQWFPSSGEQTGNSPNHPCYGMCGVVGLRRCMKTSEKNFLERP